MKRGLLLILGMFMMVSSVEANHSKKTPNRIGFYYSYNNAVNFIERGIEFYVFTNGEFDFDTRLNNRFRNNRNIRIDRDFRGRIRRIGNVFINYDVFGNVTRVGDVFLRYRRGRLHKVGNLRVRYDRWGYPNFYGQVRNNFFYDNGVRINLNIGDVCDYNDRYFFRNDFRRNYRQIREDNNYFYYRANPNAKIGKRSKILRRRKPATVKRNSRTIERRNSNNVYRKPASVNSKRTKVTRNTKNDRNSYRKPITDTKRNVNSNSNRRFQKNNKSKTVRNRSVTKRNTERRKSVKSRRTKS